MGDNREELIERVTRAIEFLQDIQGDSRTPLGAAIALVEPMRKLTDCRRALRTKMFQIATDDTAYADSIAKLKRVADTLATDLVVHEKHMQLVTVAAQAADAVLKVAIAVGAMLL